MEETRHHARCAALWLIDVYRNTLGQLMLPSCRYMPSCSRYAQDALKIHGLFAGSWMALRRILRCHPLAHHVVDPVPPRRAQRARRPNPGSASPQPLGGMT